MGLSILFGIIMINSGLNKFFHYMPYPEMPEMATAFMGQLSNSWVWSLLAIVEIIAGVLFFMKKTRALGAIMIFPIVIGIFLFHAVMDPHSVAIAIVLLVINLWVIYENREKYFPMLQA